MFEGWALIDLRILGLFIEFIGYLVVDLKVSGEIKRI